MSRAQRTEEAAGPITAAFPNPSFARMATGWPGILPAPLGSTPEHDIDSPQSTLTAHHRSNSRKCRHHARTKLPAV